VWWCEAPVIYFLFGLDGNCIRENVCKKGKEYNKKEEEAAAVRGVLNVCLYIDCTNEYP